MNQDIARAICDYLDNRSILRWSTTCMKLYDMLKSIPLPELCILSIHTRAHNHTSHVLNVTLDNHTIIERLQCIELQNPHLLTLIPHMIHCRELTLVQRYTSGSDIICELPSNLLRLNINGCFMRGSQLFGMHGLECLNVQNTHMETGDIVQFTTSNTLFYKFQSRMISSVIADRIIARISYNVQLPSNLHTLMIETHQKIIIQEEIPQIETLHINNLCESDLSLFTGLKTIHVNNGNFTNVIWPTNLEHLHFRTPFTACDNLPIHIQRLTIVISHYSHVNFCRLKALFHLHTLTIKGYCSAMKQLPSRLEHLYIDHFATNLPKLPNSLKTLHIHQHDRDNTNPWPTSLTNLYIPQGKSTHHQLPEGLLHLTLEHYKGRLPSTLKSLSLKTFQLAEPIPSIETCRYIPNMEYYAKHFHTH